MEAMIVPARHAKVACPDCFPYAADPRHRGERFGEVLESLTRPIRLPVRWIRARLPRAGHRVLGAILSTWVDLLRLSRVLEPISLLNDRPDVPANYRLSAQAARARGAKVVGLRNRYGPGSVAIAELSSHGRRWYFESLPLVTFGTPVLEYDDKLALKTFLASCVPDLHCD